MRRTARVVPAIEIAPAPQNRASHPAIMGVIHGFAHSIASPQGFVTRAEDFSPAAHAASTGRRAKALGSHDEGRLRGLLRKTVHHTPLSRYHGLVDNVGK
jgi:hypothetical protein